MNLRMTVAALPLLFAAACCCKGSVADRLAAAKRENTQLEFEIDATEKANAAMRDYIAELEGKESAPTYSLYFSEADLTTFARKAVPYRIPAKSFNKQLEGTIVVDRVYDFRYQPGNKLTCKMDLHGVNIRFTGDVPDFAKKMVKEFIEGVEAGVIADLDVTVTMVGANLKALAQATQTKLKKNSNDSNEQRLRDEMNKRALKDPLAFNVRVEGYAVNPQRVVITGNHLVIGYRP